MSSRPNVQQIAETLYLEETSPIPCPRCGSRAVVRLHRSSIEMLVTAVSSVYPYLCKNCYTKFYERKAAW